MKQAVTELCRGMGVEISEQDSEKLRKGTFHPGRDTSTEWAARDAKNIPAVHLQNANWKEFPPLRAQTWTAGSGVQRRPGKGQML